MRGVLHFDAEARGVDGAGWWGASAALLFVPLLVYLLYRSRIGERTESFDRQERFAGTGAVVFLTVFVASGVVGPPDPFTQIRNGAVALPVGVVLGYLLVWRGEWSLPEISTV